VVEILKPQGVRERVNTSDVSFPQLPQTKTLGDSYYPRRTIIKKSRFCEILIKTKKVRGAHTKDPLTTKLAAGGAYEAPLFAPPLATMPENTTIFNPWKSKNKSLFNRFNKLSFTGL